MRHPPGNAVKTFVSFLSCTPSESLTLSHDCHRVPMSFTQIHKLQVELLNFLLNLLERLLPLCFSVGKLVKGEWEPGD
jgi:hypothetical protein